MSKIKKQIEKMLKLKELRKKHKITQQKMADILGVSFSCYWGYENGTRKIPPEILIAIADYFDVSVDFLLNHEIKNKNVVFVSLEDLTLEQQEQIRQMILFFKHQNELNNN